MKFLNTIDKQSRSLKLFIGFALIGVVGVFEFIAGYEIEFSLFYVIPVSFISWFLSRPFGLMASFASAGTWLWADIASGHPYFQPITPLWNTLIRLSFFLIIAVLLSSLRNALEHEAKLARTDNITGAINSRLFYELAQREMDRLERYGHFFTLVYIDLDNFKALNDNFGHVTGDQALRIVVRSIQDHIRKTDVVARLGGDEFAVLLPETNQEAARIIVSKFQAGLLDEMRKNQWPITLSIGVLTCQVVPSTVDVLVHMTDELMYSIKCDGKNAVKYSTFAG